MFEIQINFQIFVISFSLLMFCLGWKMCKYIQYEHLKDVESDMDFEIEFWRRNCFHLVTPKHFTKLNREIEYLLEDD